MSKQRKLVRWLGVVAVVVGIYPAFVLGYTWSYVFRSELRGGRNGPLDAYRHVLASSVVAHTIGEPAVDLITWICESKGKDSNRMDRHNNRIGANIGTRAQSLFDLEPAVRDAVAHGTVDAHDVTQITWLPETKWRKRRVW